MKSFLIRLAVIMVWVNSTAQAAHDGFGVGFMIGEPTGISMKKWVGADRAYAAGAAWSFSENDSIHLHIDYLIHRYNVIKDEPEDMRISLYYGMGARVKLKENNNNNARNDKDAMAGVRIPLGVSYSFTQSPVDLFMEFVPVFDVVPDTRFDFNAAFGVRYYFK